MDMDTLLILSVSIEHFWILYIYIYLYDDKKLDLFNDYFEDPFYHNAVGQNQFISEKILKINSWKSFKTLQYKDRSKTQHFSNINLRFQSKINP